MVGPILLRPCPPFELEAEVAKEINRRCEVIDDDSYVVHSFRCQVSNLQSGVYSDNGATARTNNVNTAEAVLHCRAKIANPVLGQGVDRHRAGEDATQGGER